MSENKRVERATAVYLYNNAGHVLLLLHPKYYKWVGPGGHVEDDETTYDGAIREVKEETGIELSYENFIARDIYGHPLAVSSYLINNSPEEHTHEVFEYAAKIDTDVDISTPQGTWFSVQDIVNLQNIEPNVFTNTLYIYKNFVEKANK